MKNKKINGLVTAFTLAAIILLSAGSVLAGEEEVYMYVDVNGNLRTEVADTPMEAIVDAELRASDSGVMIVQANADALSVQDEEEEVYMYVDVNGNLRTEVADTPMEAIVDAELRASDSGVMIVR